MSDTRLGRWINAAYRHMCLPSVHAFREMQGTYDVPLVTGTSSYSLSAATVGSKVVGVRSAHHILATTVLPTSTKRRLTPRNIRWLDRRTLVAGSPTVYALEAETIHLHPIPTAAENGQFARVRYWKEPTALSAASSVTVLASYYDEVLLLGAQWMAERSLGYNDRAEATKQNYIGMLNEGPEQEQVEGEDWDFQVDVAPALHL